MKKQTDDACLFAGSNEKKNKIINSLRVGVLLQGKNKEILYINKAALVMLGLPEDELSESKRCNFNWDVVHEDGSPFPCSDHPVSIAIEKKEPVTNVIMGVSRLSTRDRIWLLVNAEPLLDEKGNVDEVICSFSDITERKAVEEKLNWLYQSLENRAFELSASNADLERFLYVATHDLQEPLRLVNSFTQLLKKKYGKKLDKQANEYINYAVEGATRIKKLIIDLLEYSKFSSNNEQFVLADMNSVLKNISSGFSKELKDIDAELIIHDLPVVYVNLSLIRQLFENLIGNAIKFRSDRKLIIQINCIQQNDNYLFSINDNGIGLDPKYSEQIFILFRRLHGNNETYDGTGAGLAMCKKIAELHQGTIWVETEEGRGSTFYFTIRRNKQYEKI